jgi:hypothetical protein
MCGWPACSGAAAHRIDQLAREGDGGKYQICSIFTSSR